MKIGERTVAGHPWGIERDDKRPSLNYGFRGVYSRLGWSMMTLPPIPPSDSLYKFTAIGGLILVVLSLYLPWKLEADLHAAYLDMRLELAKHDVQAANVFQAAAENITGFDAEANELQKEIEILKTTKSEDFKAKLEHLREFINDKQLGPKEVGKKLQQFILPLPEVEYAVKKLELSSQLLNKLKYISQMTLGLGTIMTMYGFWNWYFKFQVHQDRIIKTQAEQLGNPRLISLGSTQQVGSREGGATPKRADTHSFWST